ncbi:hypothetical protein [Jiulongibacter sp. NS-SX5]|uniref:hypothetical protein n=1 Tax=Jiulongibacter sp. NS-SX5 TaxID=3463854 RepID=UPI00405827A7
MKKLNYLLLTLLSFSMLTAMGQDQAGFFDGSWKMVIYGTPQGDLEMTADFTRENDELTGSLINEDGSVIDMTRVDEGDESVEFDFSAEGYDLTLVLEKVDENNLEGTLMNMFDVEAERVQAETDYFVGEWEVLIEGTPNGDVTMILSLEREDDLLSGVFLPMEEGGEEIEITDIEEDGDAIEVFFYAQGYDLNLVLEKEDENNLSGSLAGMFDSSAKRIGVETEEEEVEVSEDIEEK